MLVVKKSKFKKIHILIVAYIILIITELFFCVPYHSIQIFKTNQNVPHTEIVGNGYATMEEISNDRVNMVYRDKIGSGKIVDTSQLFMNVSITTALAVAIYFLMKKNEEVKELPILDVNTLAFATEEEVEQAQREFSQKMYEYIKQERRFFK